MRKALLFLLIFVALLVAPIAVRYLSFYDLSRPARTAVPAYDPAAVAAVPTPPANGFVDEPDPNGRGLVLLDEAHDNQFTLEEIGYLDGSLAARGFDLQRYTGGSLASALRPASALVVVTPLLDYSAAEIRAVSDFVQRGGRLLLVGDPTRFDIAITEDEFLGPMVDIETNEGPLNSLANAFDVSFNSDYLYNTVENEGNFRNIILRPAGFAPDSLADGLDTLTFYSTQSLQVGPGGTAVITADDNTWSSATDRPGDLVLAASSSDGRVLALGDVHFLTNPYYTVYDNSAFIARIADFLTDNGNRDLALDVFPYFLRSPVNLIYTGAPELGPDAFDEIIALQTALRREGTELRLAATADSDADTFYAGIYNEAEDVADILERAGVALVIDPPVAAEPAVPEGEATAEATNGEGETETVAEETRLVTSPLGNVQMSGTALIVLEEQDGQRNMVVLAASAAGLENMLNRLIALVPMDSDATADCLVQANLALCPTNVTDEPVEARLDTSGAPDTAVTDETAADEGGEETPGEPVEIDAAEQGSIAIGDTVEGTLAAGEAHAWIFSDGPAFLDIVVEPADDLDAVIAVYDPDNVLIASSDREITAVNEEIRNLEIPDDGDYTIVVSDFFDNGGSYTLTLSEGTEPEARTIENIFIFADDNGTAIGGTGFTSAAELEALLSDAYEVTTWVSSTDGPLQEGALDAADLVIWDSGNYQDDEGFLGEDSNVVINYLNTGGDLFVIGSSPTLLGPVELAPTADVEVVGNDPILLEGLEPGAIIALDQTYETAVSDVTDGVNPDETAFFVRGPESEQAGTVVGLAAVESTLERQKSVILLVPFTSLPADVQETLLANIINWFIGA